MAKGCSRAGGRAKKATDQGAPDIYQQMLAEAEEAAASSHDPEGKAVKKRRVGGRIVLQHAPNTGESKQDKNNEPVLESDVRSDAQRSTASLSPEPVLQTIDYNPEDSEDSEDDEFFEDVDIEGDDQDSNARSATKPTDSGTLDLVLRDESFSAKASSRRRRAVTAVSDKKMAFRIHKMHLLCLLSHLSLRNHWCNDPEAQQSLRKLTGKKKMKDIMELLTDGLEDSQYTRDLKLRDGLQQLAEIFKNSFQKTARGMSRAWWDAPENNIEAPSFDDLDLVSTAQDFRQAAKKLEGSRDLGAQLFCTLLRALCVEVRLVHSLQVLPINGAVRPEQQQPLRQPAQSFRYEDKRVGMADSGPSSSTHYSSHSLNPEEDLSTEAGRASGIRRKLAKLGGRSSLQSSSPSTPPKTAQSKSLGSNSRLPGPKRFRESSCPVYWVEVFSPAYQKWIPMDPLVTNSFSKPQVLCPAQKDPQNVLAYVIGMDENGSARDITRRYTTTYNAKTRKLRVDGIAGSDGSKWWRKVLRVYRLPVDPIGVADVRDSIEEAEFKRREAREGMPKNVEDFKGHPLYVLERHVRRNEVIHPKRQVGTAGGERSASNKGKSVEAVFRRQDVHHVKSADAWYRLGREIKVGEQPMKRVPLKRRFERSESEMEDEDQGLYAFFQTELYQAPPVMLGKIPRNDYGNLDVYVPSMIPPGAVHILHHDAKHAARLLKVDCADAVTGFEFRGRQGTAVVKGVVVAAEFKEAMIEVLKNFEAERSAAAEVELARECLRLWRRFLVALRVKERVSGYAREDEEDAETDDEFHESNAEDQESDDEGGFEPEPSLRAKSSSKRSRLQTAGTVKGDFTIIEGPRIEDLQEWSKESAENPKRDSDRSKKATVGPAPEEADDSLFGDSDGHEDISHAGGFIVEDDPMPNRKQFNPKPAVDIADIPTTTSQSENLLPVSKVPSSQHEFDTEMIEAFESGHKKSQELQEVIPGTESTKENEIGENGQRSESPAGQEDDRGSLLSEDPEDFDADPDWLN